MAGRIVKYHGEEQPLPMFDPAVAAVEGALGAGAEYADAVRAAAFDGFSQ